jgi:hypothetical protein
LKDDDYSWRIVVRVTYLSTFAPEYSCWSTKLVNYFPKPLKSNKVSPRT